MLMVRKVSNYLERACYGFGMNNAASATSTSSVASRLSTHSSRSASCLTPHQSREHGLEPVSGPEQLGNHEGTPSMPEGEAGVSRLPGPVGAILRYAKEQYFLIGLGLGIVIASQHQVPGTQQGFKETVVTYLCVSLIFLITGCTLPTKVLLKNYSRWKTHLYMQVQCFLVTSAVAFGVVSATATNTSFMDPGLLIGMVLVGVVPTTISSNVVLTRQANGNTALTVVESTVGNLLAPFLTPLLIKMYTSTGAWYTKFLPQNDDDYGVIYARVFKQLGLSMFVPLAIGQVLQNLVPEPTTIVMIKWKISKLSSLALIVIIWSTYDQAFESGAFDSVPASNIIFLVFISIALFFLWLVIAFITGIVWLPAKDVVAACYCIPAKTPAMGIPLVQTIYAGLTPLQSSKLQVPLVFFQGLQIAGGSLLIGAFQWWVNREENKAEVKEKPSVDRLAEQAA